MINKSWSKASLFFFLMVAVIGTTLRAAGYFNIPLGYRNLVHAHSHTGFQGWVYTIMFLIITSIYISPEKLKKGKYSLQFKLTLLVLAGVLVSFSLQGYGLYSIVFSTLFQVLNYWFIYRFLKDTADTLSTQYSLKFIKTGLHFGLISTLLPYAIGITSAKGLNGTELYQSLIYTFLHFQYNGWFLFIVIGLFFRFLEIHAPAVNSTYIWCFYWFFTLAFIPATALSLLGMSFSSHLLFFAIFAAVFQIAGLICFLLIIKQMPFKLKSKSYFSKVFLYLFLISFVLKVTVQGLSVLPSMWELAFFEKNIVLAYLHLSLIGTISFLLIAWLFELGYLGHSHLTKTGSVLLISGFFITEIILLTGGLHWYYSQDWLIAGSAAMVSGVLAFIFSPVVSD